MVKRRGKPYPEKTRADAVEMYLSGPEGLREVAKALDLQPGTLHSWVQLHRAAHPEDKR